MKSSYSVLFLLVVGTKAMYRIGSDVADSSIPRSMDDYTLPPPLQVPKSHHHHYHHGHEHSNSNSNIHHSHNHNNNNNNKGHSHHSHHEQVDDGWRQENHHHNFHSHSHHQEQEHLQEDGEHLHQEDSPYYGRYGSNKYNHQAQDVNCHLPDSWKGLWFQSGITTPIQIDSKSIDGKGNCYESSGDKFLFFEKSGNCHRCVVINQRHHNVLEYKESPYCEEKNSLDNLCSFIPGDAQLYSLFRTDAQPIPCPFKGPYTFTYNKGSGLCKSPLSYVDTCTEPSRLLLRYQACPDVMKSESTVEELQCLAQWRDSTYHYLVGKLNYHLAVSLEDQYRCFVYEMQKGNTVVKLAASGDATCNGLSSPIEGAKTLTFTKVNEGGRAKCKFPSWVSSHHWHSLDGKVSVKTKNSTMHIVDTSPKPQDGKGGGGSGGIAGNIPGNFGNAVTSFPFLTPYFPLSGGARIVCQSVQDLGDDHVSVVAQHTEGCSSSTVCIHFYRRDSHVIELQIRRKGSGYDEDFECGKPEALGPAFPFTTLIRTDVSSRRCPYLGKYMAAGVTQDGDLCLGGATAGSSGVVPSQHGAFHTVVVGCGQRATMDFHSKCVTQDPVTSYECHGSWEENGTGFLIASPLSRSSTSARRFCFKYIETDEGLQFFSSSQTCRRDLGLGPNVEGIWAFNLTVDGQCAEPMTGGTGARSSHCDVFLVTLLALLVTLGASSCSFPSPLSKSKNNTLLGIRVSDLF